MCTIFTRREAERLLLEQWVLKDRCRVVSVLGLGGIGKSALSVTFMHQVAPAFQHVVFRSLRDAPHARTFWPAACKSSRLSSCRPCQAASSDAWTCCWPASRRSAGCLVLDNLETFLQEHDQEGRFRAGYEDYTALLGRVAQTPHQSCLLLTSRESPPELEPLESNRASVRALRLAGLEPEACEHLFEVGRGWYPTRSAAPGAALCGQPAGPENRRRGHRRALRGRGELLPSSTRTVIFSNIRSLLAEQFARLSALEQALLTWLAIVREPLAVAELQVADASSF